MSADANVVELTSAQLDRLEAADLNAVRLSLPIEDIDRIWWVHVRPLTPVEARLTGLKGDRFAVATVADAKDSSGGLQRVIIERATAGPIATGALAMFREWRRGSIVAQAPMTRHFGDRYSRAAWNIRLALQEGGA